MMGYKTRTIKNFWVFLTAIIGSVCLFSEGFPVDASVWVANSSESIKKRYAQEQGGSHVVQWGDTLWNISEALFNDGTRWKEIAKANGISEGEELNLTVGSIFSFDGTYIIIQNPSGKVTKKYNVSTGEQVEVSEGIQNLAMTPRPATSVTEPVGRTANPIFNSSIAATRLVSRSVSFIGVSDDYSAATSLVSRSFSFMGISEDYSYEDIRGPLGEVVTEEESYADDHLKLFKLIETEIRRMMG